MYKNSLRSHNDCKFNFIHNSNFSLHFQSILLILKQVILERTHHLLSFKRNDAHRNILRIRKLDQKISLLDLHSLCLSMYPFINMKMPEPNFTKFGMLIVRPKLISSWYSINPSCQTVFLKLVSNMEI
jgi:hypothetical protein